MDLTIVTYHYVRDLQRSRYPGIKARTVQQFEEQLDFISKNYAVVTAQDVVLAVLERKPLPPAALWLTFDDGYIDHFTNVFPRLHARGLQGTFFVPASSVQKRQLLDVNKVQFILSVDSARNQLWAR